MAIGKQILFSETYVLEVVMSNVGTYLTVEDVISDLNIMIIEAPIPNDIAMILANVVGKLLGEIKL